MNAEVLRHRTKAVRRIKIRVAFRVGEATPETFVLVLEQYLAKIVQIRRFRMQQRAEHAFAHHAQHRELTIAVAAVLHEQTMPLHFLGRIHQLPAFIDREGDRHFATGMLSGPHRGQHDRRMPRPWRCRVHEIDIVALHQPLKIPLAACIQRRSLPSGVDHAVGRALRFLRHDIGEGGDLHAFDGEQFAQHRTASQPCSHDRNTHDGVLFKRNAEHAAVAGHARWREVHAPVVGARQQTRRRSADRRRGQRGRRTAQQVTARHAAAGSVRFVAHTSVRISESSPRFIRPLTPFTTTRSPRNASCSCACSIRVC